MGEVVDSEPVVSLIVAMAENRVIGRDNGLPWRLPADLRHFKQVTMGKPVLMGRKTFESIGRPLPGRRNIVLSRSADFVAQGCETVTSIDQAVRGLAQHAELMVIGGANIYRQTLPLAHRLYLTLVGARVDGDARFPELDWSEWREVSREDHAPDERNRLPYSFRVYERD